MADHFLQTLMTPPVLAAQREYYGNAQVPPRETTSDVLGEEEVGFIEARDSFYMASISPDGWPYIQHRGGIPGFLKVLGSNRIAFADLRGNRQLLTTGNLSKSDRVALFLMDYPNRSRLKLLGRASVLDARQHSDLARNLAPVSTLARVERVFQIDVESFDWNCPQFITPRYTTGEIQHLLTPLRQRIQELESELLERGASNPVKETST